MIELLDSRVKIQLVLSADLTRVNYFRMETFMSEFNSEQELIAAAKINDPAAWREMLSQYGSKVYGIALRFLLNDKDAEDVVQEVWLTVSKKISEFRGESKLGTWLYRIAVNKCLERLRSKKNRQTESIDQQLPQFDNEGYFQREFSDWSEAPDLRTDNAILKEEIEKAIWSIPDQYREVLVLRDVEGLSGQETADVMGLTEAAVKTRLHRARAFVRERFTKKFGKKPWYQFLRTVLV